MRNPRKPKTIHLNLTQNPIKKNRKRTNKPIIFYAMKEGKKILFRSRDVIKRTLSKKNEALFVKIDKLEIHSRGRDLRS